MKNKYQRMNKEEKLDLQNKFYQTEFGKTTKIRLIRVLISGILCSLYSIYLFIDNYLAVESIWIYSLSILVLIAGIIFIIGSYKLRIKHLNNFAIKKRD